jgi:hypothetical protein
MFENRLKCSILNKLRQDLQNMMNINLMIMITDTRYKFQHNNQALFVNLFCHIINQKKSFASYDNNPPRNHDKSFFSNGCDVNNERNLLGNYNVSCGKNDIDDQKLQN